MRNPRCQRGATAGAGQRLHAGRTRQRGGVCSVSPLLQPCYGLCCAGLTSPPALVGMQLVSPSKPSYPVFPASAPVQDQSCTFSPCSPREDTALGAPEGFCSALQKADACCAQGCCSLPSTTPALCSVRKSCVHNCY